MHTATAHEHHAQSGHSRSRKAPRARPATATSPVRRARPTPSRCALAQGNATLKHTTHCGTPCTMSVFEPLGAEGDAPRNSRGSHASLLAQDPSQPQARCRGGALTSRRAVLCLPPPSAIVKKALKTGNCGVLLFTHFTEFAMWHLWHIDVSSSLPSYRSHDGGPVGERVSHS